LGKVRKFKLYAGFFLLLSVALLSVGRAQAQAQAVPRNTGQSQSLSNIRSKLVRVLSDTIRLDTLSFIPLSVVITNPAKQLIDTSFFRVDNPKALIYLNRKKIRLQGISVDTLLFSYRVFPFNLEEVVQHKDMNKLRPDKNGALNPFQYSVAQPSNDLFKTDGLTKNGSISRGVTFGSNQDLAVNSNLNLQVAGKLSDNVNILLAATDNNIPIQAEGTTQQLQDFDKVFIQINDKRSKLIAGDFEIANPASYFMRFHKKAQGANFTTKVPVQPGEKDSSKMGIMTITGSAGISRGMYGRNLIQGIDGNQGPYFLTGNAGEQFVVVLSGTEKVYIDGFPVVRGQDNDYTIDYNTAQITFTAKRMITKDSRITVEFQYSSNNYARSLYHIGDEYKKGNLALRFNAYSEEDNKNKPVLQQLTDSEKLVLANAGNNMSKAVYPGVDSVAWSGSLVLYQKIDTMMAICGPGPIHVIFYRYSTDSTKAKFQLKFSQVTQGNYRQVASAANGNVFQWVAPVNCVPQGNFEPVIQLIAPKSQQLVTLGADYKLNANTMVKVEGALSNNNINTFSTKDKSTDVGTAFHASVDNVQTWRAANDSTKNASKSLKLVSNVNYEYLQQNFQTIERYRSIEFERDWNRIGTAQFADQNLFGAGATLTKPNLFMLGYSINTFLEGSNYNAYKQSLVSGVTTKTFKMSFDGSLMNSASARNTSFLRHKGVATQRFKLLTFGIREQEEHNQVRNRGTDTLSVSSAGFFEWTGFISNSDTSKMKTTLSYKQRTDYGAETGGNAFKKSTYAQEAAFNIRFLKNRNNLLSITSAYRTLEILDTLISKIKPDQTLLGRIEHTLNVSHGLLTNNVFYEVGSGQEVKQEFTYVQVPDGTGVYQWVDYNHDGIKQLNEFEVATYKDQADYIKIYTPTNQMTPVFTNQFSESFNIRPAAVWSGKKGIKKIIALFSDQTSYRVDKKTTEDNLDHAYNPVYQPGSDTSMKSLTSSFRSTLFFNQLNSKYGIDFNYQDVRTITDLTDGLDSRLAILKEVKIRWNITRAFSLNLGLNDGEHYSNSQFFATRDFDVLYSGVEPKISYQPNTKFRVSLILKFVNKENVGDSAFQKSIQQNYGLELRYNVLQKGSFGAKVNFIQLTYNDDPTTPVAYEMLEALRPGLNVTWNATYQRNLAHNLTISFNYDGRKSSGSNVVNTGGAQVRAYF